MSSSASLLPSPSVSLSSVPTNTGNLLSNVPPPSALPSFVPTVTMVNPLPQTQFPAPIQNPIPTQPLQQTINIQPTAEPFYPTQFRYSYQFLIKHLLI